MSAAVQGAVLAYFVISLARDSSRLERWLIRRRKAARARREAREAIAREVRMSAHRLRADAMIREVVREVGAGGGA